MKKNNLLVVLICLFIGYSFVNAQPLHQPIPNYTNDLTYGRVGHSSTLPTDIVGGMMERAVGGIGATATEHFLCHNAFINSSDPGLVLVKKNALNGATINMVSINIGTFTGQPLSTDNCHGLLLDPTLNRLYLYGSTGNSTNANAFILCYNMSTLALVSSFGVNGLAIIETNASVSGLVLTGVGNNILASINKTGGTVILREYNSSLGVVMSGLINLTPSFTVTTNTLKKGPNGRYYLCGGAKNTSGAETPIIFDYTRGVSSYTINNSSSPTMAGIGTGFYRDFDFWVNPSPANPSTYQCDIIAVGNTTAMSGIYTRYIINNSVSYYAADPTFKNTATLPGTATTTPAASGPIIFTKCLMHTTGYTTVLGYYASTNSEKIITGYLTPTGNQYVITYTEPSTTPSYARLHKGRGMIKDLDGNILISGCSTGMTYTTVKLSNTYDCRPAFNLKGTTGNKICAGNSVTLNANISTPNCTLKWEIVSPNPSVIYNGLPASIIHYPSVTTTYLCTVTNNATGCTSTQQVTIQVENVTPSFSIASNLNPSDNFYTLFATPTNTNVSGIAGFGYAWIVEEIVSPSNQTVISGSTASNPSCWWIPAMTNDFNGYDGPYFSSTGLNPMHLGCGNPTIGRFTAGHTYRITRGTWSTYCPWSQYSVIVYMTHAMQANNSVIAVEDPNAPDYSQYAHSTGIIDINDYNDITIYPNPSTGLVTFEFLGHTNATIQVVDLLGKTVKMFDHKGTSTTQNLSDLNKGVYIANILFEGKMITRKISIQ